MARSRAQLQNDLTEMFKDGYDYQESKEATDSKEAANSTQNEAEKEPAEDPKRKSESSAQVFRYPYKKYQETQDSLLITAFDFDRRDQSIGQLLTPLFKNTFQKYVGVTEKTVFNPKTGLNETVQTEITQQIGNLYPSGININIDGLGTPLPSATDTFNSGDVGELLKNASYIYLPIPQQISDSMVVDYAQDKLNPVQGMTAAAVGGMLDPQQNELGNKVMDILKTIGSNPGSTRFTGEAKDVAALQTGLAGMALRGITNVSPEMLISRASGQIFQSNLELLFSGVALRTFPFVFDFAPRNEPEAREVMRIIKEIKYRMAPSKGSGLLLSSPSYFLFSYRSGKDKHPFLNQFKLGVLTDMSVNYTAGGNYASYGGKYKAPVHMRMQLTFKEVNPVYQEDYEDLFDAGIKGVGY